MHNGGHTFLLTRRVMWFTNHYYIHIALLLTRMQITFLKGQYLDRYIFDGHKKKNKKAYNSSSFVNYPTYVRVLGLSKIHD